MPAPAQSDYAQARESLLDTLQQTALNELRDLLEPGDLLLTTSPSLTQIIASEYTPQEIQPADWLSLQLRAEFEGLVARGADLQSLAQDALNANLPSGYTPVEGTLTYEILDAPVVAGNIAEWLLFVQRQISAQVSESQAVQIVLGKTPAQAVQALDSQLPLDGPVSLTLLPAWWPRLPLIPFRVQVQFR